MNFLKRFGASLTALTLSLITIFFILDWVGRHGPGVLGTLGEKTGELASGQAYTFK